MAETCIVCLGDLDESLQQQHRPCPGLGSDSLDVGPVSGPNGENSGIVDEDAKRQIVESSLVAHLLPCGHDLHDECLKPWVERANSCPICRANFNMVELRHNMKGPVVDSYVVDDKRQVAEIDPAMIVDDDLIDAPIEPCMICEEFDDEEKLLLCDGCNSSCHTFCAGLDGVPAGQWFCFSCEENARVLEPYREPARQRTGAQQRRQGSRPGAPSAWAQVWQSVWNRINLDLDFPFDDEEPQERRTEAQRREFNEWQRRFRVAARQGGATRFRDTAGPLLDHRVPREGPVQPQPESQDELRAWNAFEKAKEIHEDSSSNRRKRKSATSSPAEPAPPAERRLKRPRTRRDRTDPILEPAGESSVMRVNTTATSASSPGADVDTGIVPSFLRSLLHEVETSPTASEHHIPPSDSHHPSAVLSPRVSSPGASPAVSNHPTPGIMTPPPQPLSPPNLTSTISPIYPRAPEFPPYSPANDSNKDVPDNDHQHHHHHDNDTPSRSRSHERKPRRRQSPDSSPLIPRSKSLSPNRLSHSHSHSCSYSHSHSHSHGHASPVAASASATASASASAVSPANLSYSTKSEIQRMVTSALKPFYRQEELSKEQYTDINRDVSRLLYDRIGDAAALENGRERKKWQDLAAREVRGAVRALRG